MGTRREPIRLSTGIDALPTELCRIHGGTETGTRVRFLLTLGGTNTQTLRLVFAGGGFDGIRIGAAHEGHVVDATRAHTLPDWLRPDLRLLVCGLNPSPYAADSGVPFGRPGNRFWPAAARAGLVDSDRDLEAALHRGIGFTDLVKRTTRASSEITADEYRRGAARLEHLAALFAPRVICFVGLEGVRKAIDPRATAGPLDRTIGGSPAYVMPSTSGRNASAGLDQLVEHLRRASPGNVWD